MGEKKKITEKQNGIRLFNSAVFVDFFSEKKFEWGKNYKCLNETIIMPKMLHE